jgi:hypothetical protein
MNDLVAGRISMPQAMAYWRHTRKGAIHRISMFEDADARYRDTAPRCRLPSSEASGGLLQCEHAVEHGDRVLRLAATAIETWRMHVHDMEMMQAGKITAAQASRMWNHKWRIGNRQFTTYNRIAQQGVFLRCP